MKLSAGVIRTGSRVDAGMVALLAALVILPLYPKVGLIAVSGTYIPVRLDDFVTLAVLGGWAITLYRARRLPRLPPIAAPVVAWLAIGLLAVALGAGLLGTINWGTGALFWAKPIEYLGLGWAAYDLVDRPERRRLVLYVIFATASIVVAYTLLERFGWLPHAPNYATDVTVSRVLGSTMGDSHQLATYLGVVLLMAIALWHRAPRPARVAGLVGFGISAYVLVHAAGRSEFLSLAICTLPLAFWRPARLPAVVMLLFLAFSFVLPQAVETALDQTVGRDGQLGAVIRSWAPQPGQSSAPSASAPPPVSVAERFDDLEADRSLEMRLQERWPVFFRIAMRDPIFGAGPSAATEAADGYYIRSFTEVGVAGTLAFGVLILSVLLALWRVIRSTAGDARAAAVGLISGTIFIGLVGVLIDSWVASRVMQLYWPAVGATLAALVMLPSPSAGSSVGSGVTGPAGPGMTG